MLTVSAPPKPRRKGEPPPPPPKRFNWSSKFEWRRLAAKAGYTWAQFVELDPDLAAFELAYARVLEKVEEISNY